MKVSEILRLLERDGWALKRVTGSHRHYVHPSKPGLVTEAGKSSATLKPKTEASKLDYEGSVHEGCVVVFEGADGTGYSAYSPDLLGVVAAADTREETEQLILEAMIEHLALLRELGQRCPSLRIRPPSRSSTPLSRRPVAGCREDRDRSATAMAVVSEPQRRVLVPLDRVAPCVRSRPRRAPDYRVASVKERRDAASAAVPVDHLADLCADRGGHDQRAGQPDGEPRTLVVPDDDVVVRRR